MQVWGLLIGVAAWTANLPLDAHSSFAADAADRVGAAIPWTTYEAEAAKTTGEILGPDFTGHTPAREASGRRCVRLSRAGQYLEFTAKSDAQGVVVRYSIPDSADGNGENSSLAFSVNGRSQPSFALNSKLSHLYGKYPFSNVPTDGTPRNFWNEVRLMPKTAIHAGDVIRLEKAMKDSEGEILIDFVDLEAVPTPIPQPADALSIVDFGATANGGDAHDSIIAAISAAKTQHQSVWIPAGTFLVKGSIDLSDIAIRGAGMWYSHLVGVDDYSSANRIAFNGVGSNITLCDFAISGNLSYRNDSEPNDGLGGSFGSHSTIRNLWVEHTKTGAWLTNSEGLVVEGCRFRDTIADGINLCVGMKDTVVRNCTARGNGDDCFAIWPATYEKAVNTPGGNRFEHCTAQLPFLAQAFSIYGGDGNRVEDCEAIDVPYGAGLYASTTFPTESGFAGTTYYKRIHLTRTGDSDGAIGIVSNRIDLAGVHFEAIDITDSPTDGIKFISMNGHALKDALFDHVKITNCGLSGAGHGIAVAKGAVGSANVSGVTIAGAKSGEIENSSTSFELIRGKEEDRPTPASDLRRSPGQ